MQRSATLFSFLVLALALPAGQASAQSTTPAVAPSAQPVTVAEGGPRADLARVGISRVSSDLERPAATSEVPAPPVQQSRERGRTMMLIGGALFLGGLLIGDDVGTAIAVGGLVVGVWGFYQLIR